MDDNIGNATFESDVNYCAVHRQRDTELRCNRCDRYMCIDCARRTPVGYTCRECVRGHENKFYQGTLVDYALVAAVSAVGGALTVALLRWSVFCCSASSSRRPSAGRRRRSPCKSAGGGAAVTADM